MNAEGQYHEFDRKFQETPPEKLNLDSRVSSDALSASPGDASDIPPSTDSDVDSPAVHPDHAVAAASPISVMEQKNPQASVAASKKRAAPRGSRPISRKWEVLQTLSGTSATALGHDAPNRNPCIAVFSPLGGAGTSAMAAGIAWSMSHFDLLPAWFREIHPRFRTPMRTILVFSGVSVAQVVLASFTANAMDTLANLYAFGALSGYILVLISLIRLRVTDPYTPRRWKTPFNLRVRPAHKHAIELPLLVMFGILGNFAILAIVVVTHPLGRIFGPLWILCGLGIYLWHRRRSKMPMWRSLPREWEQEQIAVLTAAEEWESLRDYRAALARRDAEKAHHVEDVS
jgi:hypothetical protein